MNYQPRTTYLTPAHPNEGSNYVLLLSSITLVSSYTATPVTCTDDDRQTVLILPIYEKKRSWRVSELNRLRPKDFWRA